MTTKHWRVRRGVSSLEVHVDPTASGSSDSIDGRQWLDTLLWDGLSGRDPEVRESLFAMAQALTGLPLRATDAHEAGVDDEVAGILRAAARDGRLLARAPSHPPVEQRPRPPGERLDPTELEPPPLPIPEADEGWFEVQVVDEVGDAIADLRMSFTLEGRSQTVVTDGSGVARLDGVDSSYATVEVLVLQELRDKVAPRWQQPREPSIPESTPELPVHLERLDDHFDPVGLHRCKRAVLVIAPRFACREVDATTFDFGRSFVRRQGIPALSAIAQELTQDDGQQAMIFGHTDRSGSELLNKRLSERRAKAVFAVLTHDFERWEEMWRAKVNEYPWWEKWGTREVQHMLNALRCPDDDGETLGEDGDKGSRTNQAIRRFKRGDYPSKPAEQAALPDTSTADEDFRRELFFAYAKLVSRDPVEAGRIAPVGGSPFMGCGEFNPLSMAARDEQSRRTVVFVFDPAATPAAPPCAIGTLGPCQAQLTDPPPAEDEDGEPNPGPFYRCEYYKTVATCCPAVGGPDLAHDVIVRFFMELTDANPLPHRFVLMAEDQPDEDDDDEPGFRQEQALGSDARAFAAQPEPEEPEPEPPEPDPNDPNNPNDPNQPGPEGSEHGTATEGPDLSALGPMIELHFTDVPDAHAYRLRVEGVDDPYAVFVGTRFHQISELCSPLGTTRFPRLHAILNAPPAPPEPPEPPAPKPTPHPNLPTEL